MDEFEIKLADVTDQDNVPALEAQLAGLSQFEHDQVMHHLDESAPKTTDDVQAEITRAQAAEDALLEAQHLRSEQEAKIAEGDLHGAKELGDNREYYLKAAEENGVSADHTMIEAQHDTMALDWAAHHQDIAEDNANSAASYAAVGDADHAAQYADTAASHADTSAGYVDTTSHDTSAAATSSTTVDTTQTE